MYCYALVVLPPFKFGIGKTGSQAPFHSGQGPCHFRPYGNGIGLSGLGKGAAARQWGPLDGHVGQGFYLRIWPPSKNTQLAALLPRVGPYIPPFSSREGERLCTSPIQGCVGHPHHTASAWRDHLSIRAPGSVTGHMDEEE